MPIGGTLLMKNNLLTIIIPVYNTGDLLIRCLDSVINQSLKEIEIIIVNDNSTDNSADIIQQYIQNYSNIKYYHNNSNLGPGGARNVGLRHVTTKYVCFLDSDDWIDTNSYIEAVDALEKNNTCDIAIFGIKTEYDSPYLTSIRYQYPHFNIINSTFALSLLCNVVNQDISISVLLGNKVFCTNLLVDNNIYFEQTFFEDELFSFLAIFNAQNVITLPNIYLHYYQRSSSVMHSFSPCYIHDTLHNFKRLKQYLENAHAFDSYKTYYYSFFTRCYISLINVLFSEETNSNLQKQNLIYFINSVKSILDFEDMIQYTDSTLLKKIFLTNLKNDV